MEQFKRNYPKSTVYKTLPMRTFNINRMSINKDNLPDNQVNLSTNGNLNEKLSEGKEANPPEEKKTLHLHREIGQDPSNLRKRENEDSEVENNQGIHRSHPITKESLGYGHSENAEVPMADSNDLIISIDDPVEPDTSDFYVVDENFDKNLPTNVILLTTPKGSKVYVVGTVHYSVESQKDVAKLIRSVRPNSVVLELCKTRSIMLQWDEETFFKHARDLNFGEVIKKSFRMGFTEGLFFTVLYSISTRMTKELGVAPGGEFRVAFREARSIPNCKILLGDLPIALTLKRLFSTLSFWQVLKIVTFSVFQNKKMSKEEIEKYRQMDEVEKLLLKLSQESPDIAKVLVSERDAVLTYSMQIAAHKDEPNVVVAVVGLGHLMGIKENWRKVTQEQVRKIMTIPAPKKYHKIIKFSIKFTVVGLFLYGVHKLASKSSFYRGLFRSFFTTLS